jgi:hypothetical protein
MLVVIAHAIVSAFYIPSFQHVYSETLSSALVVSSSGSITRDLLDDTVYAVEVLTSLPADLSSYDVIVLEDSSLGGSFENLETYLEGGGGLVYLGGAAEALDLAANHEWLGAQSLGFSGFGDNATAASNDPLGSGLLPGEFVRLQSPEQDNAIFVGSLETGAEIAAEYQSGNIFAYGFEQDGKVYFQAYADPGVGDSDVQANVEALLTSGIIWATAEPDPITDILPDGAQAFTGHNKPYGSTLVQFSQPGLQEQVVTVPADPVAAIFVTADAGLTNPRLYFVADGQEYIYNVQIDKGTLLNFTSVLDLQSARFTVDDWSSGVGRVGFVTFNAMPSCNLPMGAEATTPGSIPNDAINLGSTGPLGSVNIITPPVPVSSLLAGFDHEVSGYVLGFNSIECPIQSAEVEIAFDEPTVVSGAYVKNKGPWGLIGYVENLGDSTVFAKVSLPKGTTLPDGFRIESSPQAPDQIFTSSFSQNTLEVAKMSGPTRQVTALWVQADPGLADPHLYLHSGSAWYSIKVDQVGGTLVRFASSVQVDEIYASSDGGQPGSVSVGYLYPVAVHARAGPDQTVLEDQLVYLDARSSTGAPGTLAFEWTQTGGDEVELRDADSERASFSAPTVSEGVKTLSFKVTVTDSMGTRSSDVVTINVKHEAVPDNVAPTIGTIAEARVNEGSQVVIAASAVDPDGDPVKYTWSQKDGPLAKLSGANTATLSIIAPFVAADTVLTFEVRAADGLGHPATKDVLVTVVNIGEEETPPEPSISAGADQAVSEGSVVTLQGQHQGDGSLDREFKWEQTSGAPVTLDVQSMFTATFTAPQIETTASILTFKLSEIDALGSTIRSDEVSVTVNNIGQVQPSENSVEIEEEGSQGPSSFVINEPSFAAVKRVDAEPPTEVHLLSILGVEGANSPTPTAPVVGIWVNATADMTGLELHFSSTGRKYSMDASAVQATAYVFDRQVELQDVRLTSASNVQAIGIGYYYDQVPLASVSTSSPASPSQESGVIPSIPPTEGAIIKFARENQIIAGVMALGVPVGIGVGLKMASSHRRKRSLNPAKALFPKHDPVAGEAEKVRPVIEELEKMLGRDLDTAVSASELLDRFGSGRNEASQR